MASQPASNGADDALKDLLPEDQDLLYEEELLRNPYSLRMWWRYLEARKEAPAKRRYLLFERALKALPGSYKVLPSLHTRSCYCCCCRPTTRAYSALLGSSGPGEQRSSTGPGGLDTHRHLHWRSTPACSN